MSETLDEFKEMVGFLIEKGFTPKAAVLVSLVCIYKTSKYEVIPALSGESE